MSILCRKNEIFPAQYTHPFLWNRILCVGLFRPDDQDALAGKGQISLAVAALDLAGDKGHRAAAPTFLANIDDAREAGERFSDAQGAGVLVFLLTVDQLHF